MKHKRHKLRVSNWINGKLNHIEEWFDTLEEAFFKSKHHHGQIKIYDEFGIIKHTENKDCDDDTYA